MRLVRLADWMPCLVFEKRKDERVREQDWMSEIGGGAIHVYEAFRPADSSGRLNLVPETSGIVRSAARTITNTRPCLEYEKD